MTEPQRFTDRPLPAYRHVPGETPHPTRDPEGHSYGAPEPAPPSLDETDWRECETYLYGLDLFNLGYWWECHEALEGLWHASGHGSAAGQCLQALIQCAVAHLKKERGNLRGARKLLANAERHAAAAGSTDLGIDMMALLHDTHAYVSGRTAHPARVAPLF